MWQDLMDLAAITDPSQPYTRRSFSPRFLAGRRWLESHFAQAGLTWRYDTAANLIGRREGREPGLPPILMGSHSDTVPSGGRFDGALGLLAGLEVLRALDERGISTRHPIELVDFLAEEPSEYGVSCVGSRAIAGALTDEQLALCRADGESLGAAMSRIGGAPEGRMSAVRSDVAAFLELHIEQGRVLESSVTKIGIVTGIVGIIRFSLCFTGAADHAGATPFDLRQDALVAAAQTVSAVRAIGEELAARGRGYVIATTGCITVEPNAANVVPRLARLVVEMRAEDAALMAEFASRLDQASAEAAATARVTRTDFTRLSYSQPALSDARLMGHFTAACKNLDLSSTRMASGAGHDAAFMARIAPAAMIFVPSREGRSHCPEEWTDKDQCADGAAVLLETLLRVDQDPSFDTPASSPAQPAATNETRHG